MGEPTFNENVLEHAKKVRKEIHPYINRSMVHPVVSTMMPKKNKNLVHFLQEWCKIKNDFYKGDAGLQLSINSTSDTQRKNMFSNNSLPLAEISEIGDCLVDPVGRKYALNFALADDYIIDAQKLAKLFSPSKFMVKITPLHKTHSCVDNKIETTEGYTKFTPYKKQEKELKDMGFDVLVFIPSIEEDLGRITCGNAILSGSIPEVEYKIQEGRLN
jgi:23S rRNA (adenine2503-C2)-methyltransferase